MHGEYFIFNTAVDPSNGHDGGSRQGRFAVPAADDQEEGDIPFGVKSINRIFHVSRGVIPPEGVG